MYILKPMIPGMINVKCLMMTLYLQLRISTPL